MLRESVQPRGPKEVSRAAAHAAQVRSDHRRDGSSKKSRVSSLNFVSYSCCQCHDGGTTDLLGSCHEAGKLASSTESRAHAVLLLDRVAVRARRSPTAEIDIVSSMDYHFHHLSAADRAFGE